MLTTTNQKIIDPPLNAYFRHAEWLVDQFIKFFKSHKINIPITRTGIGIHNQNIYLFIKLDARIIRDQNKFNTPNLKRQLSAAIGANVAISTNNGIWFVILIREVRKNEKLPPVIKFPGNKTAILQLGMNAAGEPIEIPWKQTTHMLIAGMTGSGKTNFARLIMHQALYENYDIYIIDPKHVGYSYLEDHPNLKFDIATNSKTWIPLMDIVCDELTTRMNRFKRLANGAPVAENLESFNHQFNLTLPRTLVFIDETNTLIRASGGVNSKIAQQIQYVASAGRQFGINLVLIGQTFHRDQIAYIRDQIDLRICFRVAERSTSSTIIGTTNAFKLSMPGHAISNLSGEFQSYLLDDDQMIPRDSEIGLTPHEIEFAKILIRDHDGKLTYAAIRDVLDYGQPRATTLRNEWIDRGLASTRPDQNNALILNDDLIEKINQL